MCVDSHAIYVDSLAMWALGVWFLFLKPNVFKVHSCRNMLKVQGSSTQ